MPEKKSPPRLDETFLVADRRNMINVGSAYSLRREGAPRMTGAFMARRRVNEAGWAGKLPAGQRLRPEFEKIVREAAQDVWAAAHGSQGDPRVEIEEILRDMAHAIESAEGEDPAELDQGGPKPGTTGGGR